MTPQQLQAAVERLGDDRVRQGFERFCREPRTLAVIVGVLREATPPRNSDGGRTRAAAAVTSNANPSRAIDGLVASG
jgi:hypothetical protein